MSELATKVADVPIISSEGGRTLQALDVLVAAVRAPRGWVRTSPTHIIAPRRCQRISDPYVEIDDLSDEDGHIAIEKTDWISVLGDCTVEECRQWIVNMREEGSGRGRQFLRRGTIFGIVDKNNQVSGVVEIEDVMSDDIF
jgi:hypothetical protein